MSNARDTFTSLDYLIEPDLDMGFTEEKFHSAGNLAEGVNGQSLIDSTFENTSEEIVNRPRSDGPETGSTHRHPAPRDQKLWDFPQRRF